MQFLVWGSIVEAARACYVVGCLVIVGLPVSLLLSRARCAGWASLPVSALCGLAWLSLTSWYAFDRGIDVRLAFRGVLWLGAAAGALLLYGRLKGRRFLPANDFLGVSSLAFVTVTAIYAAMAFSKIRPGDLPWLTIGNGDLLAYLKVGNVLLHLPHAAVMAGEMDVREFARTDLYGAFDLIAFAAFVMRVGVENCAIPGMAAAVGLLGSAVAVLCRRTFLLPWWLSVLVSVLLTTSPLVSYVTLQYFLGQMLLMGALATALPYLAALANGEPSGIRSSIAMLAITSVATMLCYPPWYEQFVALAAAAFAAAQWRRFHGAFLWRSGKAAIVAAGTILGLNAIDAAVGSSLSISSATLPSQA